MTLTTSRLVLEGCTAAHIEALIAGSEVFEKQFGLRVMEGYLEFPEALPHMLKDLGSGGPWASYLFIHPIDHALIGLGGYKGAPDSAGMVEIGYGIAHAYRNQGYAAESAQGLIDFAFRQPAVQKVWAHTLAEDNASSHVLKKCGLRVIEELNTPDDGPLWRWEIVRSP
ncbi:MAG: GNAT family N-acetyltransferase [Anaerolineae bacterium]